MTINKLETTATIEGQTITLELTDQFLFIRDHECILMTLSALRWPAFKEAVLQLSIRELSTTVTESIEVVPAKPYTRLPGYLLIERGRDAKGAITWEKVCSWERYRTEAEAQAAREQKATTNEG